MSTNGIGFILAVVMMVTMAFWTRPDKPGMYLDAHGGFTVVVGTALIALISVPWGEVKTFFPMVRVITKTVKDDNIEIVDMMVQMADAARVDMSSLKTFRPKITDPFLGAAIDLLTEGFEAEDLETILKRRIEVQKERENNQMKMFKNLGKYPPACELMGTVFGMIALLGSLGQEGAGEKIGPSMSVALAATLYGVICANMLILPVAGNLSFRTQKSVAKRQMIVEGIMLIHAKTPSLIVREMLLSHIAPGKRGDVKDAKGGAKPAAGKAA